MKFYLVLAFGLFVFWACSESAKNKNGMEVFNTNCALCHGKDGKLGLNDSKDITVSQLSLEEVIELVRNGKGMMNPYKDLLTEEQIRDVSAYTLSLRQ